MNTGLYNYIASLGRTKEIAKKVCMIGLFDCVFMIFTMLVLKLFNNDSPRFGTILLFIIACPIGTYGYYCRMKAANKDNWNNLLDEDSYFGISDNNYDLYADVVSLGRTKKRAKMVCMLWIFSIEVPCILMVALKLYDNSYPTYGMLIFLIMICCVWYYGCYQLMKKANPDTWNNQPKEMPEKSPEQPIEQQIETE